MEEDELLEQLQAANDMTFSQIRDAVCQALCQAEQGFDIYPWEMYPDQVIYRSRGQDGKEKLYRRSYAIADKKVTLGDAVEVTREVSYVPVQTMTAAAIVGASGDDDTGAVWRVRVIAFGADKLGNIYWDKAALVAALPLFNGAKVFALEESQHHTSKSRPKYGKSPRELVGALAAPEVEKDGIYANLVIMPSASWLQKDLQACAARNIPYVYGLSIDIGGKAEEKMVAAVGKKMTVPKVIQRVEVDVVHDPVGKGEFLEQLAAAREAGRKEEEMFQRLMAALKGRRPDLHKQIEEGLAAGSMTEEQALELVAAAVTGGQETGNQPELVAAVVAGMKEAFGEGSTKVDLLACSLTLDKQLLAAKLPARAETQLRAQFGGRVFEETELTAAIKSTKELCDELTGSGNVHGMGGGRVMTEPIDRLQAACDRMMGLQVAADVQDVAPFTSLRAAYVAITGDTEVRGYMDQGEIRRLQAAGFDSSTFAFVLGNTLYRRMIGDYQEIGDYGVSLLVGQNIRNARDFRSLESVRIAYFSDLPDVDPENDQDYSDLGTLSDEKVDYVLGQKGGTITISRKMIINDDIRAVDTIRRRLPRAARRTLAKKVWNLLITNATFKGDNKACFHTDHNNLDATAFGLTALTGMKTRLFKQVEPQSGEQLSLKLRRIAVPEELWGAAVGLNQTSNFLVNGTTTQGNPFYHFFGANNEGIFEIPFNVDANDFYGFADPNEAEIVELAFLNGQQEPEMFVADNPNFGQFFIGDRIQYKIRHEYNCVLTDFRGVQKNIVA